MEVWIKLISRGNVWRTVTRVWPVGVLPTVNQDGSGVKSEYRNSFQKITSNLCMIMKNWKNESFAKNVVKHFISNIVWESTWRTHRRGEWSAGDRPSRSARSIPPPVAMLDSSAARKCQTTRLRGWQMRGRPRDSCQGESWPHALLSQGRIQKKNFKCWMFHTWVEPPR